MLTARFVVWMFSITLMVLGSGMVSGQATSTGSGQDYPNKPIRIVSSEPGGTVDLAARIVAQGIAGPLGQQVIIDNRAGIIAIETVAKAQPDGYTVILSGSTIWIDPLIRGDVSWDPVRDFSPITLAVSTPNILVVHPSLPVKSVKELIALARTRPGVLNYGASAAGGSVHLAAELFTAMAGVNIVRIRYKGVGQALNALIAGEIQILFPTAGSVAPHIKSGRLRALAVTGARPSTLAPGLPTVTASGLPGYDAVSLLGLFAPAKTHATIINRLNQEVVRFLETAEAKEKFFKTGVETVGSSPDEFAAKIKSEMARMGKVINDAGIRAE